MNSNQIKTAFLKTSVASFACIGVFGFFALLQDKPKPINTPQPATYHYEEPIDRYNDTTLSRGQRQLYNEYWEK